MMYRIEDDATIEEHWSWIRFAVDVAKRSQCLRSKCGAVIVNRGNAIGWGWNSPPKNKPIQFCLKDVIREDIAKNGTKFKSDMNCCICAERRAIDWAIEQNEFESFDELFDFSIMYFIRLDDEEKAQPAGRPYCTMCSKRALDIGISGWILWHGEGVWENGAGLYYYSSDTYNEISFKYREKNF